MSGIFGRTSNAGGRGAARRGVGIFDDLLDEILGDEEEVAGDTSQPGATLPADVGGNINTVYPNDTFVVTLDEPGTHRGECARKRTPAGRIGQFVELTGGSFWSNAVYGKPEAKCQGVGPIWGTTGPNGSGLIPEPKTPGGGAMPAPAVQPPPPPPSVLALPPPTLLPAGSVVPILVGLAALATVGAGLLYFSQRSRSKRLGSRAP